MSHPDFSKIVTPLTAMLNASLPTKSLENSTLSALEDGKVGSNNGESISILPRQIKINTRH